MAGREYHFWVYVLASRSRNLYVGMTNDLLGRLDRHRAGMPGTHTERYRINRLVYFEYFRYVRSAIAREKEMKRWRREERVALIERGNPTWEELWPAVVEEKRVLCGGDEARTAKATAGPPPGMTRQERQGQQQERQGQQQVPFGDDKARTARATAGPLRG